MQEYRIVEKMATGNFGTVFRITRRSDGTVMVMKRIPLANLDAVQREMAKNEIVVMQRLHHPHIVSYHDAFLFNGDDLCIIMDFYGGGDLEGFIRAQREVLEAAEWKAYHAQLLEGKEADASIGSNHPLADGSTQPDQLESARNSEGSIDRVAAGRAELSEQPAAPLPGDVSALLVESNAGSRCEQDGSGRLPSMLREQDVMLWFVQMCLAVHYLHQNQIVHCDLKTHNIFLDATTREVVVGDFGVSKVIEAAGGTAKQQQESETSAGLTSSPKRVSGKVRTAGKSSPRSKASSPIRGRVAAQSTRAEDLRRVASPTNAERRRGGSNYRSPSSPRQRSQRDAPGAADAAQKLAINGTPLYMAPELLYNSHVSTKGDVWALGCILYELLTLRHPFDARDLMTLVINITQRSYPPFPPSSQLSAGMLELVDLLLQKDPTRRPTCEEVLALPFVKSYVFQYASMRVPRMPPTALEEVSLLEQLRAMGVSSTIFDTDTPLRAPSPGAPGGNVELEEDADCDDVAQLSDSSKAHHDFSLPSATEDASATPRAPGSCDSRPGSPSSRIVRSPARDAREDGQRDSASGVDQIPLLSVGVLDPSQTNSMDDEAPMVGKRNGRNSHSNSPPRQPSAYDDRARSSGPYSRPAYYDTDLHDLRDIPLAHLHREVQRYRGLVQEEVREQQRQERLRRASRSGAAFRSPASQGETKTPRPHRALPNRIDRRASSGSPKHPRSSNSGNHPQLAASLSKLHGGRSDDGPRRIPKLQRWPEGRDAQPPDSPNSPRCSRTLPQTLSSHDLLAYHRQRARLSPLPTRAVPSTVPSPHFPRLGLGETSPKPQRLLPLHLFDGTGSASCSPSDDGSVKSSLNGSRKLHTGMDSSSLRTSQALLAGSTGSLGSASLHATPPSGAPLPTVENADPRLQELVDRRNQLMEMVTKVFGLDVVREVYAYYAAVRTEQREPGVVMRLAPQRSTWRLLPNIQEILTLDQLLAAHPHPQ